MKVIIIGGVAGGATAAARIRRLDENAEIIIFEKSKHISYANCGLPYYIGNTINDERELTLQNPENFWKRFRIEAKIMHEVIKIDIKNKKVKVKNIETSEIFEESYDKLILSPGANPIIPNIDGINNEKIFTLRTVEDAKNIKDYIKENSIKKATIVGAGFIGIEMAENLSEMNIDVTIIEGEKQVLNILDYEMACIAEEYLERKNINISLGSSVIKFEEKNKQIITIQENNNKIESDIVILAIGVKPDSKIVEGTNIELGIKNSIVTNEKMETNIKDIYAVGDVVEIKNKITNQKDLISLAGPANKQARIVANNIYQIEDYYKGAQGTSIIKLFDMTIATTGINEKKAKNLGLKYDKIILSANSHASYYPNSTTLTLKIIFEEETLRILGAQIIGYEGVDKRIDVIATAIYGKISAVELKNLDLSYAPPYSSAKDPVNMAGYMIENIVNKKVKQFHYDEIDKILELENTILLDIRTKEEYEMGHIKRFINIPLDELRERIEELDKNKTIYIVCESGLRSYIAYRILEQKGFNCYHLSGGYKLYRVLNKMKEKINIYPCGMDKSKKE